MRNTLASAAVLSIFAVGFLQLVVNHKAQRNPAANEGYTLELQSVALDSVSRVDGLKDVFLRATFNNQYSIDISKAEPLSLARGERKALSFVVDIKDKWIKDDSMDFKLEIVEAKSFNKVILRCAQVAKEMSVYNRAYQCNIPGESVAVLSYRLARKGSAPLGTIASTR